MAEYGVVTKNLENKWALLTKAGQIAENQNLLVLLDGISAKGWEAVAVGDLGFGSGSEILVRK